LLGRLGYTLDDVDDDSLAKEDHNWLDRLTMEAAHQYAVANGYDLGDYASVVGFTWMILAEQRGLLTLREDRLVGKPDGLCLEVAAASTSRRPLLGRVSGLCRTKWFLPVIPRRGC
jgi:hypothetical protein